eukprot:1202417-Amphidinium_carterae.1
MKLSLEKYLSREVELSVPAELRAWRQIRRHIERPCVSFLNLGFLESAIQPFLCFGLQFTITEWLERFWHSQHMRPVYAEYVDEKVRILARKYGAAKATSWRQWCSKAFELGH